MKVVPRILRTKEELYRQFGRSPPKLKASADIQALLNLAKSALYAGELLNPQEVLRLLFLAKEKECS
jgi:hypothetical protein